MKRNHKNLHNESASFNMPEKKEREKGKYEEFILKLMGRIFLTKKVFFGFYNTYVKNRICFSVSEKTIIKIPV